MIVKLFKARFAPLVAAGTKRQTVRPTPKRLAKVGDVVSLRTWTGLPYRSKQRVLRTAQLTAIWNVRITKNRIMVAGRYLLKPEMEAFAIADGFAGIDELLYWFEHEHGLPFKGVLYKW